MANESVSINNLKENLLEFELSVDGLDAASVSTKFVIQSADMDLAFPCKRDESGKWSVKLPPLPMLERTAYPFHLQVVAEGFHFEPLKGSVNVVGSPEVYAAGTKNTKVASPTAEPKAPAVKEAKVIARSEPTNPREKPIEQIARELMESQKAKAEKAKKPEVNVEVKPIVAEALLPKIEVEPKKESTTAAKDKAARKVLEDLGLQSKKPKAKSRFSLKN